MVAEEQVEQNYFMVNESNVVDNCVVWNGDLNTWSPSAGYTMLVRDTTPAMNWVLNETLTPPDYELKATGIGDIQYLWNGVILTTQRPKPEHQLA